MRRWGCCKSTRRCCTACRIIPARITNEDKAVDTPYNLYIHKGLPPTPIANPGSAALERGHEPQ